MLAGIAASIDLSAPACLIMGALLHFFDAASARALVARYVAADRFFRLYMADGPAKLYQHSADDFATFFGPLELVPPGVGDARTVRPGWAKVPTPPVRDSVMIVGIARVG